MNTSKRREWIKNAIIVFLTVMLLLTFFSNTIMNYSLPEVAIQNATSASITAKVRGSGIIEASDPYNVEIKESRVIASVSVKQGDTVEKGDVLFTLEDAESAELTEAQKQLDTFRTEYEQAILSADSSTSLVDQVESGEITSSASKLAKIDGFNNKIDRLESAIESYNNRIAEIDNELSKIGDNSSVDTSEEQQAVNDAAANLAKAENAVKAAEDKLTAASGGLEAVNSSVKIAEDNRAACQAAYDEAVKQYNLLLARKEELENKKNAPAPASEVRADESSAEPSGLSEATSSDSGGSAATEENTTAVPTTAETRPPLLPEEEAELERLNGTGEGSVTAASAAVEEARETLNLAEQAVTAAEEAIEPERIKAQAAIDAAQAEYNNAVTNRQNWEDKKAEAERNLANKEASRPDTSRQDELNNEKADLNLKVSKATADKAKAESDLQELLAEFGKEVNLVDLLNKIKEQEALVEKLKANATDAVITAPVSGMISTLNYVAGETTSPERELAQIVMTEKGFTLSFSVTSDQAKKISVGDVADIQNSWYYNEIKATVAGFKADPSNPQNRLVVFDIVGDVQAGQNLSLSVGQKSANYDIVVPNSAIREDNNGKFILIVESKSSPLGNRYIATRVDVEILASDDTMSAISGGLYGYESVITTSTKPVEAGKQVRLANN